MYGGFVDQTGSFYCHARYQRVLALCAFFNRGNTAGTNSSEILCLMFVEFVCLFVLCGFVTGLILWFWDNW